MGTAGCHKWNVDFDVDALVKKIDAKIAELEEEERKEKEKERNNKEKVVEIANKYGLKLKMWGDYFYAKKEIDYYENKEDYRFNYIIYDASWSFFMGICRC